MLTDREKTVIREWNEFAAKMPPSLHEMRKALDAESAKMNVDPPAVGAFHPGLDCVPDCVPMSSFPRGQDRIR